MKFLTFSGLRVKRDMSDFSYPISSASATSAPFSSLIVSTLFSNASAIASNILLLSSEVRS